MARPISIAAQWQLIAAEYRRESADCDRLTGDMMRELLTPTARMPWSHIARVAAVVLVCGLGSRSVVAAPTADTDAWTKVVAPAIQEHCAKCHGAGPEIQGETNLVSLDADDLTTNLEVLRNLIEVLDQGEMPPEDEPPLDAESRQNLVRTLKSILQKTAGARGTFAPTPIRRMNRFQYNNAVSDLFDLKCIVFTLPERVMRAHKNYFRPETGAMPAVVHVGNRPLGKSQMIEPRLAGVAAFPQDLRAEHGFDNRGDHLSLSPLLMSSFLQLGESITESPDFGPKYVGIWATFFAPPGAGADLSTEVRRRLAPFLQQAFRRPVEAELLNRYASYIDRQLESGVGFTDAMKSAAAATISSPRFLYLFEESTSGTTSERINDFELASRLSYLLWGSIPDQQLLDLARGGELSKPDVLDAQINRMLADRKLKRFCDSFPTQWLQLDRLISSVPNEERFPEFYFSKYRDSMHMMLEPLLLFETVLIENRSILQLIDSDFTFRSAHLEESYGELRTPGDRSPDGRAGEVTVLTFHRVPVTDRRNGGVITNAAVMTMTSGPERTQPITRGAWVASVIFNDPPDPPPADVPPLAEKPSLEEADLTLRERLALHRERADCRGCHEQIDPLGFALENYDPVGVWRSADLNGREIDASGRLFRRHAFTDVVGFKDAILAEKDRFTRALAGHLLSYALARELAAADEIALDRIVEATAADEYRMQTLIRQVILSDPFLSKTSPPADEVHQ